jgi:O-antigen/teichoic acid export membrane protein
MFAELVAKGSLFLVTVYLAGVLGAADFGRFAFLQTLFVFAWMGVDLGLNMYAVREVARRPGDVSEFVADFSGMRLSLALVLSGATLAGLWLAGSDPLQLWLAGGFALYLVVRSVQPDWLLRGLERYFELAVVNVVMSALLLLATWALIRDSGDARLASLPWFLSYLLGTIGMVLALRRRVPGLDPAGMRVRPRRWLGHWRESVHFTLSNGVATLYQNIPVLYVYALGSATMTGIFAAPFRLVIAMIFVSSVVPMVVYPIFTDLHSRGRRRTLKTLVGLMSLAMIAGAGLVAALAFVYADSAVRLLFGPEYAASGDILRWLCAFFALRSLRAVFVRVVSAGGNQRDYSIVSIASVCALLALLAILAAAGFDPPLAASIALTICEIGVVVAMAFLTARTVAQESSWQRLREPMP